MPIRVLGDMLRDVSFIRKGGPKRGAVGDQGGLSRAGHLKGAMFWTSSEAPMG